MPKAHEGTTTFSEGDYKGVEIPWSCMTETFKEFLKKFEENEMFRQETYVRHVEPHVAAAKQAAKNMYVKERKGEGPKGRQGSWKEKAGANLFDD